MSDWSNEEKRSQLKGKAVYVNVGEICMRLIENSVSKCKVLRSSTLMIFHSSKFGYSSFVIVSHVSDIFVLCIAFPNKVTSPLHVECGSKTRVQYLDIGKMTDMLGHARRCLELMHFAVVMR